jgi:uncharacterized protein YjiS (DUF1127 family)
MIIIEVIRRILERLKFLRQRQQTRKQLIMLSAYALKDVGITRSEALAEGSKPFWRD